MVTSDILPGYVGFMAHVTFTDRDSQSVLILARDHVEAWDKAQIKHPDALQIIIQGAASSGMTVLAESVIS